MKKIVSLYLGLCFSVMTFAQPSPVFKRADSLFTTQNYSMAKAEYEKVLQSNAGSALSWNRLGFSCYNLGKYDEAIAHFTKSLSLNPSENLKPYILIRLAKSYGAKNEKAKALSFLTSSVESGFQNWDEIIEDKNLQLIKNDPQMVMIKEKIIFNLSPCMKNSKSREFDFWVGDWNVFDKAGKHMGTNSIHLSSGGCALLENWMSSSGTNTAKSLTYVNSETGKWEQLFIDNGGTQVKFTDGEYTDRVMKFAVTMKGTDGKLSTGRFVFENKPNGEVRQYQEMSPDGGTTWNTWFDFIYRRK